MATPGSCCSDEAAASATGPDCRGARHNRQGETMFKRIVILSGLALVLTTASAQAQSATAAVSTQINPVLAISSAGAFTFPVAGDTEYEAGEVVSTAGPSLTHRGNVPYVITVAARSSTAFSFRPAAGRTDEDPAKPVSVLTIRGDFGGTSASAALGVAGDANNLWTRPDRGGNIVSPISASMAID